MTPEFDDNYVIGSNGVLELSSGTVVEKVIGSSNNDYIVTGGATNTLQPGPGKGGAYFEDYGGYTDSTENVPASSDTYSGFAASGYGVVDIVDWAGTTDKLVLPFASTDVYFEAYNADNDQAADSLLLLTSSTDTVDIYGQLEPVYKGGGLQQKGHIEQIQFTDGIMTIGSATPAQTLSGAKTKGSAEAQVEKLNEVSSLNAAEKEKRSQAAKKIVAEAKKKAQDLNEKLSASGRDKQR